MSDSPLIFDSVPVDGCIIHHPGEEFKDFRLENDKERVRIVSGTRGARSEAEIKPAGFKKLLTEGQKYGINISHHIGPPKRDGKRQT